MRKILSIGVCDTGLSCEVVDIQKGYPLGTIYRFPCHAIAEYTITFDGLNGINHQRLCKRHAIALTNYIEPKEWNDQLTRDTL